MSCSAKIGCLGVPKAALKWSTTVETLRRHMMRLAVKAGRAAGRADAKATSGDFRGGLPPRVIRKDTTEARNCTSKERQAGCGPGGHR